MISHNPELSYDRKINDYLDIMHINDNVRF